METRYKRGDLKKLSEQRAWFYPECSLVADKLRAIYVLFGWTHMTKDFMGADDNVESLTMSCVNYLLKNEDKSDITSESAGLRVNMWIDSDDVINIEYGFSLN